MTLKRAKAVQKRIKKKAKERARVRLRVGGDICENFLNIAFPPNAQSLTDELYEELAKTDEFAGMKKSDFDSMKKDGCVFNPDRRSFVYPAFTEHKDFDVNEFDL